jgi:hypothetical protein
MFPYADGSTSPKEKKKKEKQEMKIWCFLLACKTCFWRDMGHCKRHAMPYNLAFRNCTAYEVKFNTLKKKFTNFENVLY